MARENDHSATGVLARILEDVGLLKTRLAVGVIPERLSTSGEEVTDWDDATAVGWYWGNSAANAPFAGMVMGEVYTNGLGLIVQRVLDPSHLVENYATRVYSGGVWGAWVVYDTGWVTLTPNAGWSASSLRGRRVGRNVDLQGSATSPSLTANVTAFMVSTTPLPTEFIPTGGASIGFTTLWSNGEYNWGAVNASGQISVRKTTTGIGTILLSANYMV